MKKRAVATAAAGLGLVLAVGAAGAPDQSRAFKLSTRLSPSQEVPAPTGDVSAAGGTFSATVTPSSTGATLSWQLTFTSLTGPAGAAHIHLAPQGQPGPVAVPLCGPCESPVSGTANVDANVLGALEAGRAYVNVHTPANAAGEIRGQVAVTAAIRTVLGARQEVPRPKGNVRKASGLFTATVTRTGSSARLAWRLTFSRLSGRAVAAHVHAGQRGKAGAVILPLCGPCRSGARKSVVLQASVLSALESGRAYVNVHTARNAAGEIRGQIAPVPLGAS